MDPDRLPTSIHLTATSSVAPEQWTEEVLAAVRQVRGNQPTPTLADRARDAWAAQEQADQHEQLVRETERVADTQQVAASYTEKALGVRIDPGAWTVRPAPAYDDWAPPTADVTYDGLRLTFEWVQRGQLLLTWRCPVSDCGANRQTSISSLADLGHALATVDEPNLAPGSPWFCAACMRRRADNREATPEPSFAEQLEQLVRHIVRDEMTDGAPF